MDDKKDIRPIEQKPASLRSFDYQRFFSGDSNFAFIFRKTEKIVAALYMISDLFENQEPLKWGIRQSSIDLMSYISSVKDNYSVRLDDSEAVEKIKNKILKIISLIDVAFLSGLISEMNVSVLKKEFSHLLDALERRKETPYGRNEQVLKTGFFAVEKYPELIQDTSSQVSAYSNKLMEVGTEKEELSNREYKKDINIYSNLSPRKESSDNLIMPEAKNKPILGLNKASHMLNKDRRRNNILSLFNKKTDITIKDVLSVIKNCSEKTIQRELLSLVGEGILRKEGEKRWSKYFLVN